MFVFQSTELRIQKLKKNKTPIQKNKIPWYM